MIKLAAQTVALAAALVALGFLVYAGFQADAYWASVKAERDSCLTKLAKR